MIRTLKEICRHALHISGVRRKLNYLKYPDRRARFAAIYETEAWTHGDKSVPRSGHGSSPTATEVIRKSLPALLTQLQTQCLLDVGCGDFTWMKLIDLPCKYIGTDIVSGVIENNTLLYGSNSRSFFLADSVVDSLPEADTVLCREVLFHLSFHDALSLIRNIISMGPKFFIITTDRETLYNSDIETGDFRMINLERRPFQLPSPFIEIPDDAIASHRLLAVWRTEDIERAIS